MEKPETPADRLRHPVVLISFRDAQTYATWLSAKTGRNVRLPTEAEWEIVKGGSWDDHGRICRPAARHGRPVNLKHILIGFRLVDDIGLTDHPSSKP